MNTVNSIVECGLIVIVILLLFAWIAAKRMYRRAQRTMQAERDRLDAWIEASPVGIIVFNEAKEVIRLNAEASRLLKGDSLDLFGKKHGEVFQCAHWKDSPQGCEHGTGCLTCPLRQAIGAVLAEKKSVRACVTPMTVIRDGLVCKVWLRIGVQPFQAGDRSHVIVSIDDVTEAVQTLDKLKQATAELERLNEKIQQASEAKGRFLAHMSHEIRTPLNGIIGMTDLLSYTELNDKQQEFVHLLHSSSEILLEVVNGILDLSKLEAGKMTLENKAFNMHDCLEEVAQVVGPAVAKKRLELVFRVDPGMRPMWIVDALRLRQILVNLVSNAVKFTERGEVVVSVSCGCGDDGEPRLQFEVRDTGIGILPGQQSRLFEPFIQADGADVRRGEGTGLGLLISKQLCELMGGMISVESRGVPGRGSIFRFSVRAQPGGGGVASDGSVAHVSLPGKKVLVADDNASSSGALLHQVEAWGMKAQSVTSGSAALSLLQSGSLFDLVLVDSDMIDMSGLALAREIGALREVNQPRMVLLRPSGEGASSEDLPCSQISSCVAKPVNPRRLHDALVAALASSPTAGMFGQPNSVLTATSGVAQRLPLRILVAEDNLVNQSVILGNLANLGYAADVVANGLDAVQAVKERIYDLVLMDGEMPEMDGDKATEVIRKEVPVERQPWIVAMTADVLKGDRERYLASGMNDYLAKPIRPDQLRSVLSQVPIIPC